MEFVMNPYDTMTRLGRLASTIHAGKIKTAADVYRENPEMDIKSQKELRQAMQKVRGRSLSRTNRASSSAAAMAAAGVTRFSKSRTPSRVRHRKPGGVARGGYDNQTVGFYHGHAQKVNKSFVAKIRNAISAQNTYATTVADKIIAGRLQCAYGGSPMMYGFDDLFGISNQIASSTVGFNKFTCHDAVVECTMSCASNTQITVKVFECQAREDVPYISGADITGVGILSRGLVQQSTTATLATVGPYQSTLFCQKFRIVSEKTLKFNPGEQKIVHLGDRSLNNINMARWFDAKNSGNRMIIAQRARSKFLLFQVIGQVSADSANLDLIGTAGGVINIIYNTKYRYTWNNDYAPTVVVAAGTTQDSTSSVPTAAAGNPTIISEMTGLSVVEVDD